MKDIINKIKISQEASIKEALKRIDETGMEILFVCDGSDVLIGSLTDGDIRRRILKTGNLQEKIETCFNHSPIFALKDRYALNEIRNLMLERTIKAIPIIDKDKRIIDVLFWNDLLKEESVSYKKINIPIVIMAGGRGERLGPFTKILPKPLIPIGDKPALELILDRFSRYGASRFFITLNYKGEMIKSYLEGLERQYKIDYVWEKEFLGTAGSLRLMPDYLKGDFIVSNCDIVVDADYADLLSFHKEHKNILTVAGSIQHHKIPYGVIHFGQEGRIKTIQEKPEFDLMINTGVYMLSSGAIDFIPEDKHFDMTDLIKVLLDNKQNVGVYPVSEKSYVDIGELEEYKKVIGQLELSKWQT